MELLGTSNKDGKPIEYTVSIPLKEMILLKKLVSQELGPNTKDRDPKKDKLIQDFDKIILSSD